MSEKTWKRIFVIVIDSLGIGGALDGADYGDEGTDTLGHISESVDHLWIPNLRRLGLVNLHPLRQMEPEENPRAYYGRLNERSCGKDTMTGHWEMMGLKTESPLSPLRTPGFQRN